MQLERSMKAELSRIAEPGGHALTAELSADRTGIHCATGFAIAELRWRHAVVIDLSGMAVQDHR